MKKIISAFFLILAMATFSQSVSLTQVTVNGTPMNDCSTINLGTNSSIDITCKVTVNSKI
jgi:hypothetical protein